MEYITITISAQTLGTIGTALNELPYKMAKPAIDEIDVQVRTYLADKKKKEELGEDH